ASGCGAGVAGTQSRGDSRGGSRRGHEPCRQRLQRRVYTASARTHVPAFGREGQSTRRPREAAEDSVLHFTRLAPHRPEFCVAEGEPAVREAGGGLMTDLRDQLQSALGSAYALERELGGGGMSRVFVAREMALGRLVVVKVLP